MMRHQAGIKPSRIVSVFAAIVGIGMLFVFAPIFLGSANNTPNSPNPAEQSPPSPISGFFILWVVVLVGIVLYHLINALSGNAPPIQTIDIETTDSEPTASGTTALRLRELEQLKQEELITDAEYEQKRQEILNAMGKGEASA